MLARQRSQQSKEGRRWRVGREGPWGALRAAPGRGCGYAVALHVYSLETFFSHGLVYLILTAPVSTKHPLLELSELRPLRVLNPMEFIGC